MEKSINSKIEIIHRNFFEVCLCLFLKGHCQEKFCVFFDTIFKSIYLLCKERFESVNQKNLIFDLVRKLENLLSHLSNFLAYPCLLN